MMRRASRDRGTSSEGLSSYDPSIKNENGIAEPKLPGALEDVISERPTEENRYSTSVPLSEMVSGGVVPVDMNSNPNVMSQVSP